jgi:hypothetical protein
MHSENHNSYFLFAQQKRPAVVVIFRKGVEINLIMRSIIIIHIILPDTRLPK